MRSIHRRNINSTRFVSRIDPHGSLLRDVCPEVRVWRGIRMRQVEHFYVVGHFTNPFSEIRIGSRAAKGTHPNGYPKGLTIQRTAESHLVGLAGCNRPTNFHVRLCQRTGDCPNEKELLRNITCT
jgi:hypothetical protein